jgi:branched-chain amino acid transport system ATP-binding protein
VNAAPILRTTDVSKAFGTVMAADRLNVSVAAGEIVGVVGANGAGKTVFVNMITGYEKPTSGAITFGGRDITRLAPRPITRLGISRSFQVSQVFASMTVLENLLLALSIHRNSGAGLLRSIGSAAMVSAAGDLLARFGLEAERERRAHELPQGARKLLDIAMALVGQPRVVLLDEPTSGISAEEKHGFMSRVMEGLAVDNATVLIVEHDMDIIQAFVSRVLAFAQGRIICDAAPREALNNADVINHVLGPDHAVR